MFLFKTINLSCEEVDIKIKSLTLIINNFFCCNIKIKLLTLLASSFFFFFFFFFFFLLSKNLIFIQKNKLKKNIFDKKIDNKFIINSSRVFILPMKFFFFFNSWDCYTSTYTTTTTIRKLLPFFSFYNTLH